MSFRQVRSIHCSLRNIKWRFYTKRWWLSFPEGIPTAMETFRDFDRCCYVYRNHTTIERRHSFLYWAYHEIIERPHYFTNTGPIRVTHCDKLPEKKYKQLVIKFCKRNVQGDLKRLIFKTKEWLMWTNPGFLWSIIEFIDTKNWIYKADGVGGDFIMFNVRESWIT